MYIIQNYEWRSCKIWLTGFGMLFIKQRVDLTDEEPVEQIRGNACMRVPRVLDAS
jgi:hypothetical protein